jgi:hypothetical protein
VCCFENAIAGISAYDIREWMHNKLNLKEEGAITVQVDEQAKEEESLPHFHWTDMGPCSEKPAIKHLTSGTGL